MYYKILFKEELSKDEFIVEMEKISSNPGSKGMSFWNSHLEDLDAIDSGIEGVKFREPVIETIGGLTFTGEFPNKDIALRTFRRVILDSSDKVKQVYINGGEYVIDPKAWFEIPKLE